MVLQKPRERRAFFIFCPNTHELSSERLTPLAYNITVCLIQNFAHMTFNDLKNKIFANYEAGAISDYELSGLVDDIVVYLNLKTTTNTAEFRGKSFNGIKNFEVPAVIIDGIKFYKNNY